MSGIPIIMIYHPVPLVLFQGLTRVEKMLISAVLPIMTLPVTSRAVWIQCHLPGHRFICQQLATATQ